MKAPTYNPATMAPRIHPARARPRPPKAPPLAAIRRDDRIPSTIATGAAKQQNRPTRPVISEAMAKRSVGGANVVAAGTAGTQRVPSQRNFPSGEYCGGGGSSLLMALSQPRYRPRARTPDRTPGPCSPAALFRRAGSNPRRAPALARSGWLRNGTRIPETCTFAQSRSSPSCAEVSSIRRDTCKASAETTTSITRDAFVVL